MPPRRRLLSWPAYCRTGVVVRWRNLAGRGSGRGPAIVAGKACQGPWSPPRQESCRGSSSSVPTWIRGLPIFMKGCMLPGMRSQNLGLNIVDGVRALNPKGGGSTGLFASCPSKEHAGGLASRLGKTCCRAWPCFPLDTCYSRHLP